MPRSIRDKFPASVSTRRAASVRMIFLLMRACRSLLMPYSLRELQRLSRIFCVSRFAIYAIAEHDSDAHKR